MKNIYLFLVLFVSLFINISCESDDNQLVLPQIITLTTKNVSYSTALSGGNITDDGGSMITKRGVCYGTCPTPTKSNSYTSNGSDIGGFSSNLINLKPNTIYYVRAYATNSEGTIYGNEESFVTGLLKDQTLWVEGGSFYMGSPEDEGYDNEHPKHEVTVCGFRMNKYEITNMQYADFLNAAHINSNGSQSGIEYIDMNGQHCQIKYIDGQFISENGKEMFPVIEVSWFGATAYAAFYGGRLPTEAEWEFAAQGGTLSNGYIYSGSDDLDEVAWFYDNSFDSHIIGTKNPNELGLYDMSGNVSEWVSDWYDEHYYEYSPSFNPKGPDTGFSHVVRGGFWGLHPFFCRPKHRTTKSPENTDFQLGFRVIFQ